MPSHSKPVVTNNGSVVSVSINPNTIVTIFGGVTAAATCNQKVEAKIVLADSTTQTVSFLGASNESLYLDGSPTEKTIAWGPFTDQTSVELTLSHQDLDTDSWDDSTAIIDEMKEYSTNDLQSAISLIPVNDGEEEDTESPNTTLTVTRMTLF